MRRWIRNVIAGSVFGVTAWMCFDNVFSDDTSIRALAEKAACTKQKCDREHGMTREARTPWNQSFEYSWREATVRVECHRAFYVFGERGCNAE